VGRQISARERRTCLAIAGGADRASMAFRSEAQELKFHGQGAGLITVSRSS
jgi:hypothetical protein